MAGINNQQVFEWVKQWEKIAQISYPCGEPDDLRGVLNDLRWDPAAMSGR